MSAGYCRWCGTYLPGLLSPAAAIVRDAHQLACKQWRPPEDIADPERPLTIDRLTKGRSKYLKEKTR